MLCSSYGPLGFETMYNQLNALCWFSRYMHWVHVLTRCHSRRIRPAESCSVLPSRSSILRSPRSRAGSRRPAHQRRPALRSRRSDRDIDGEQSVRSRSFRTRERAGGVSCQLLLLQRSADRHAQLMALAAVSSSAVRSAVRQHCQRYSFTAPLHSRTASRSNLQRQMTRLAVRVPGRC